MSVRVLIVFAVLAAAVPARAGELMTASFYNSRGPHIAAHRTLPFGTRLNLFNPNTGKRSWVVVHDRGPFKRGRSLDVSRKIAHELGFAQKGTARIVVERR